MQAKSDMPIKIIGGTKTNTKLLIKIEEYGMDVNEGWPGLNAVVLEDPWCSEIQRLKDKS